MNNTELKNLLNTITPTKNELDQMERTKSSIFDLLKNNINGNVKVAELRVGGSYAKKTIIKGRKEVDLVVVISPKSKNKFFYQDLASLSMNYIENTFYLQYYDRLLNQTDDAKIVRNYDRNTLSMTDTNGVSIDFLIKFKKEQLLATTKKEVENFYLERDTQQLKFIEEANKEFSLFKNSVMLIKKFRDDEKCHSLKSYMIEIIMYYSLVKYLKGNDYVSYMNAFFRGLQDFRDKKRIEVTAAMYNKLGTKNSAYPTDDYQVIDVANKSNNVAMYVKDINPIANFYIKYVNNFSNDTKKTEQKVSADTNKKVTCNIYYKWDKNKEYVQIVSEIDTISPYKTEKIKNKTNETWPRVIADFYTHLNRIVKMCNRHNFNKSLTIDCQSQLIEVYNNGVIKGDNGSSKALTKDEKNKFDQLKNKIKQLGIKITFKAL